MLSVSGIYHDAAWVRHAELTTAVELPLTDDTHSQD